MEADHAAFELKKREKTLKTGRIERGPDERQLDQTSRRGKEASQ